MDRLVPRMLATLSREQLAEIVMALAASPGQADTVLSVANAMMATARPTPAWAVQGVLLSPDLLSQTFKHLELGNVAAASVCSEWRRPCAVDGRPSCTVIPSTWVEMTWRASTTTGDCSRASI